MGSLDADRNPDAGAVADDDRRQSRPLAEEGGRRGAFGRRHRRDRDRQGIKVNQPIALLLEEGEDPAELEKFAASPQPAGAPPAQPREAPPVPSEPKTEPAPAPAAKPPAPAGAHENGRVFASPLARRMA